MKKLIILSVFVLSFVTSNVVSAEESILEINSCFPNLSTVNVGDSVIWSSVVLGGVGPYEYSWSGDDSLSGNDPSISHQYNATGTFSVSLSIVDDIMTTTSKDCGSVVVNAIIVPEPEATSTPVIEEENRTSTGGRSSGSRRVVSNTIDTTPDTEGEVLGASTFAFNSDLKLGMSGNDVKELQERLRREGFFTFHTSTGYFGEITLAAVKAYQTAHPEIGYVTGFVGPLTRAILNK